MQKCLHALQTCLDDTKLSKRLIEHFYRVAEVLEDCLYELAWQADSPLASGGHAVSDLGHNQRFALRGGHAVTAACGVLQLLQTAELSRTQQIRVSGLPPEAGLVMGCTDETEQVPTIYGLGFLPKGVSPKSQ